MKSVKVLSCILTLILILGCATTAFAQTSNSNVVGASSTDKAIWADGFATQTTQVDAVKWWYSNTDQKYYLFLPTVTDLNSVVITYNFNSVSFDGVAITNGSAIKLQDNKTYSVTADGNNYSLTVMKSTSVGSMFFTTESGSLDYVNQSKDNKEGGNIVVVDKNGEVNYDGILSSIKGRGNTTWENIDKKPYNIKLDKTAALLGMSKSKKWCLLANGQDHSLIRNKIMYDLANDSGLTYSPDSQYADVYANGEYIGTYEITEKVEAGKNNLVKIYDLEGETEKANGDADLSTYNQVLVGGNGDKNSYKYYDIPNNPSDITGGYVLEFDVNSDDKYRGEASGFVTSRGQCVVVKDPEYCSKQQVEYIRDYVQKAEDAYYSSTGINTLGKHYSEYMDMDDLARMYLVQEFSVNIDSGITSCFFYKDSEVAANRVSNDSIIHAGPAWDFDVALGNLENEKDGVSMMSTDKWFAKIAKNYNGGKNNKTIFAQLCTMTDFWDNVQTVYNRDFAPALSILTGKTNNDGERLTSIYNLENIIEDSADMNFIRWDYTLKDNTLVSAAGYTHRSHLDYLEKFVINRTNWLNEQLYAEITSEFGDVDLDGSITIKDVTLLQKSLADMVVLTQGQKSLADFNKDSSIDIKDATEIQRFLAFQQ